GQRQLDLILGDVGQRHRVRAVAVALGWRQLRRVKDQDAARPKLLDRVVERLLVEGEQHIDDIAAAAQALLAEPDLIEAVAALDLRGRHRIGEHVIPGACGGLRDHLAGDKDTLAGFTGDADDKVFACHLRGYLPGATLPRESRAGTLGIKLANYRTAGS